MLTEFSSVKVTSLGRVVTLTDPNAIARAGKGEKKAEAKKQDTKKQETGKKKTAPDNSSKTVHKKHN